LEPREADVLPVPAPASLRAAAPALRAVRPAVEAALAAGDIAGATALVDRVLLGEQLGLNEEKITALRLARALLSQRRRARGRRHVGS
jgi:hypothetical protein